MKLPADRVAQLRSFYEGRAVLVTGGAGFIGGHLCDALVSLGATLRVIDDLSNSTLEHLAGLIELEPERIRFVHGSILDDDALAEAAKGCATVFHLAALGSVPRSIEEPQRTWSVNATGTLRVLEAARRAGAARVVFAASSSAYGDQPELPKVETQSPKPMSPYAASKLAGENLMAVWARCYGLSTVSLRYFNVFGPRQAADSAYAAVVAAFAKALLHGTPPVIFGDGSASRDFTFVGNAVLATLLAGASATPLRGEVVNVGTSSRMTVLELAREMARAAGVPQVQPRFQGVRPGDVAHSQADIGLARALLGYVPVTSVSEGLAETIEHYRKALAQA
jgi:nucleoside-diphosphate-sugar epimerase